MAGATVTIIRRDKLFTSWVVWADVAGDSSYPNTGTFATSGYAVVAGQIGVDNILGAVQEGISTAAALGYFTVWDIVNGRLHVLTSAGFTPAGTVAAPLVNIAGGAGGNVNITTPNSNGSALANGTAGGALTGLTGVQAPAFTGTPVAAGAAVEVANATNLSTLTFRMRFSGMTG